MGFLRFFQDNSELADEIAQELLAIRDANLQALIDLLAAMTSAGS